MMTHPLTVLKSCGPKLVPFFKTCAVFFVLYGEKPAYNSLLFCLFKLLPIISLVVFVLLHGMNLSSYYAYSRRIIAGLVFSGLGDLFLAFKGKYFEHGLLMFAVAQVIYATAFGWSPMNFKLAAIVGAVSVAVYCFLATTLSGIMTYLVGAYVCVIYLMVWRAIARSQIFSKPYDAIPWTKLVSGFGAIFFMISDIVIAVDKFKFPVPGAHIIIMTTYYAAQLGIALSVVDSQVDVVIEETKREKVK